jgi:stage III sporulation protein AB
VESSRQEFMRLSAEERRILADFAKGLGTSDLSGQLRQAELAILQLTGAIDALSKELSVKERLYSSLGALTGLAAAILIL